MMIIIKNDKIRMYEKSKITMYKHTFFFVYFFRRYTKNGKINYTIEDIEAGNSEITLNLNNGIYHENIELLRNNGYDVIEYESEYEIIKTIISWKRVHFAENGTFSRGYYIKNQERTENDE